MRIPPDSPTGRKLQDLGVPRQALEKTRLYAFDLQKGGAITLGIPFWGAVVLMRRRSLPRDLPERVPELRSVALLAHEFCHVQQLLRWGALPYLARHLWARIATRSLLTAEAAVERECYQVQQAVLRSSSDDRPVA